MRALLVVVTVLVLTLACWSQLRPAHEPPVAAAPARAGGAAAPTTTTTTTPATTAAATSLAAPPVPAAGEPVVTAQEATPQDEVVVGPDPDAPPPPYPWAGPAFDDVRRRLRRTPTSLRVKDEPAVDVLGALALMGVPVRMTPAAEQALREHDARVTLRLKGIRADQMLELVRQVTDRPHLMLVYMADHALLMLEGEEIGPVPEPVPPTLEEELEEVPERLAALPEPRWREDVDAALEVLVGGLNLDETPLDEALNFLRDIAGLRVKTSRAVNDALKTRTLPRVTLRVRGVSMRAALDAITEQLGLRWTRQRPGVVISMPDEETSPVDDEPSPSGPPLRDVVVDLDLRGGTLRDLAQAFERQGVPVLVTPDAWASAGTCSVVFRRSPLRDVVGWPGMTEHLRIVTHPREPGREVLLVAGGRTPVTATALDGRVPPYPGVEAQVSELRAALRERLERRARLRAEASPIVVTRRGRFVRYGEWPLLELEREVERACEQLEHLLVRATQAEAAPGRARELELALAAARADASAATAPHVALFHRQRAFALEDELRQATRDLDLLRRLEAGKRLE